MFTPRSNRFSFQRLRGSARSRNRVAALLGSLLAGACIATAPQAAEDQRTTEGRLERAVFATEIKDREPVDPVSSLPTNRGRVFFFTEIVGLEGHTIRHRWEYKGETMAEVEFDVRGPRWRVYSSKNLLPIWSGDWTVRVLDDSGRELGQTQLAYGGPVNRGNPESVPASPED